MINSLKIILTASFLLFPISSFATKSNNLTIFSESPLSYALVDIARQYSKEKNVVVSVNFKSSGDLIRDIDFGEPADIFISSHKYWIDTIKQKGVADIYSTSNIAQDKLVLITSKENDKIDIKSLRKYTDIKQILRVINRKRIPIVSTLDKDSLSLYTKEIIESVKINNHNIYRKAEEDKRSVIDVINQNKYYCGIVMASEVKDDDNVKILVEISDINIYYQALVVAGNNMDIAKNFLKDLKHSKYKNILKDRNFIIN